jgi:hypothetical protein
MKTLFDYLITQDMGDKCAENLCEKVLNDEFDANSDPISAIIINAFKNNLYGKIPSESDFNQFETDLDYAINQLNRVKAFLNQPKDR